MAQFHLEHGRSIRITGDSCIAFKDLHRFGSNWVFSRRDVKENEIICIKIAEVGKDNGRRFEIGFTDEDPAFMPIRPKTTYHLCNSKIFVPSYDIHVGTILILMYDSSEKLVYFGIDGKLKGISALYGPYDRQRWLAVKMDAAVLSIQLQAFNDSQWNSFVVETARTTKCFKKIANFNTGGVGLHQPVLGFDRQFHDPRATINRSKAIIEGKLHSPATVYTDRAVFVNEIVCLRICKISYGSTLEIYPCSARHLSLYRPSSTIQQQPKITVRLTRDETVQLICTEHGVIVQGRSGFVEASTRFAPISPTFLAFELTSMSTHCEMHFLDPNTSTTDMMCTEPIAFENSLLSTKRLNIFQQFLAKTGLSHQSR